MDLKWVVADETHVEEARILADKFSIPYIAAKILCRRGIITPEQADQFLYPSLKNLFDPFLMHGMREGVDRVIRALKNNERIMIYGDYDVDGITSASLMFLVLNRLGADVSYYLPNRLVEGYGISEDGLEEAVKRNINLLISVDCGITAVAEVEVARSKGIDCLITDHHEPGAEIPKAAVIINPKLDPPEIPGREMSAVGVAFKFAQALYRSLNQDETELEQHLDLVAMGTAADIVPLADENRILTKFGLDQLAKTNKPGLKALIFIAGVMGRKIGTGQVVFILAPRINAVGRLGDAQKAVKLLTTKDETQANAIARILNAENKRRKDLDVHTLNEALQQIEEKINLRTDRAIVLSSVGWHQGVIGIVASRIVEKYNRPTVMIAIDGGEGKGSARSIPGFHLYEALRECDNYLLRYGGHKYAAGLSIDPANIEPFREKLNQVSSRMLTDEDLVPKLEIDAELELESVDENLVNVLEQFAPFGPHNMRPVFVTYQCEVVGTAHRVGTNHLKFKVRRGGKIYDCIGFGFGDFLSRMHTRPTFVDIVYVLEFNNWNGADRIQLRIKDIKLSG